MEEQADRADCAAGEGSAAEQSIDVRMGRDASQRRLAFDASFILGHPYLQTQWKAYEKAKLVHTIKTIVLVLVLVVVGVVGANTFYHVIPLVCLGLALFRVTKWRKTHAELKARTKLLQAASWALRDSEPSEVKYTVEELGSESVSCLSSSVPYARVLVDGNKSVPKYCGSWPVRNWKILREADRSSLHCDYSTYAHGKVYHGTVQSYVMQTDTGITLWFV